jgi:acid phosphatase (class A)
MAAHTYIKLYEEYRNGLPDEHINLVRYGQPTRELWEIAQKTKDPIRDWFMDQGLTSKYIAEAPQNDSDTTRKDLDALLVMMSRVTPEDVTFARFVDEHLEQVFIDFLNAKKIKATMEEYFMIDGQTESLLHWLKNVINRPRPYQLAYYYELPLYPLIHTDANSAAYPSGHSLTAFVMSEYYAKKYPEHRAELEALAKKIAKSRELMGIHFPSDQVISREIADTIWKNNLIQF